MNAARVIAGLPGSGLLLIADHASNRVPTGIVLGIDPALFDLHIAIDIGVAPLAEALCAILGCPGVLGDVSRLVIDLNRELDSPGLVPTISDGHEIPGNVSIDPAARIERYWRPYHYAIAERIAANRPALLLSLHSFTPALASMPEVARPWEMGVLYNRDDRAARVAIPALEGAGVVTGDNLPYSGAVLNATMNRHGEANGIAYLGLEVRQDLIADPPGVTRWANIIAPIIALTIEKLRDG